MKIGRLLICGAFKMIVKFQSDHTKLISSVTYIEYSLLFILGSCSLVTRIPGILGPGGLSPRLIVTTCSQQQCIQRTQSLAGDILCHLVLYINVCVGRPDGWMVTERALMENRCHWLRGLWRQSVCEGSLLGNHYTNPPTSTAYTMLLLGVGVGGGGGGWRLYLFHLLSVHPSIFSSVCMWMDLCPLPNFYNIGHNNLISAMEGVLHIILVTLPHWIYT